MPASQALALVPRAQPEYVRCPRWCFEHFDDVDGRTHAGPQRAATGRRADVRLRVEQRDDGQGAAAEVFVLEVAGVEVEMPASRMHELMKATEQVFWKLDAQDVMLDKPQPIATPAPATAAPTVVAPIVHRGGRA